MRPFIDAALLMEATPSLLTPEMAMEFYAKEGLTITPGDLDGLKAARKKLVFRYHEGGKTPNGQKLAQANAAFDVLKNYRPQSGNGESNEKSHYSIWAWDGEALRPGGSVEGTPDDFSEIARRALSMGRGFNQITAVFVQKEGERFQMHLIYAGGRDVSPPRLVRHSGDKNPADDASLPKTLAVLNPKGQKAPPKKAAQQDNGRDLDIDSLRAKIADEPVGMWHRLSRVWKKAS